MRLAGTLLCQANRDDVMEPCGECESCQMVAAVSHPDLEVIRKPADRNFIPIELLIGDREHRMREGLCHNIALKPFCGGRKVAIVDDADALNPEGANCLLKTLEEPPPGSLIVLVGTSPQRFLPTIRSRSQIIRFAALRDEDVSQLLLARGYTQDQAEADRWAALGDGSIERAVELGPSGLRMFRQSLLDALPDVDHRSPEVAQLVNGFVDEAGKEAPARRERLRQVIGVAVSHFREQLRCSQDPSSDTPNSPRVVDAESAAACLERSLDAEADVDANASPAIVIDAWLDDLAEIVRRAAR
jgi:DNA polymerase-3 subunit delta'